jgi:hypothetical protein
MSNEQAGNYSDHGAPTLRHGHAAATCSQGGSLLRPAGATSMAAVLCVPVAALSSYTVTSHTRVEVLAACRQFDAEKIC